MANPQPKPPRDTTPNPARIEGTQMPPPRAGHGDEDTHEERLIDEAVDESFPASDPPAPAQPAKKTADPKKGNVRPGGRTK